MWYCSFCPTVNCKRQVWSSVRWHSLTMKYHLALFTLSLTSNVFVVCVVFTNNNQCSNTLFPVLFLRDLLYHFVGCVPYAWLRLFTHSVAWLSLFFLQFWHGSSWAAVSPVNSPTSSASLPAYATPPGVTHPLELLITAIAVCLPLVGYTAASTAKGVGVFTGETTAHNPLCHLHNQLLEEKIRFTCIQPKPN